MSFSVSRTYAIIALVCLSAVIPTAATLAGQTSIPFDDEHWELANARVAEHLGRPSLSGSARLKDVTFENGIIEVDLAVSGARSYPGIIFRIQSLAEYERFYIRPHRAGLYPDALQYAPVFNGVACWQLYHGNGCTAAAFLPENQWFHLKMEIHSNQARVYLDDSEVPALVIDDLKHGISQGTIGLMGPADGTAFFSNFSYRKADTLVFDPPAEPHTPPGTIMEWQVSQAFPATQLAKDSYPGFFTIFNAGWQSVTAEPSGLVNLSRLAASGRRNPQRMLARKIFRSDANETVKLSLGYSDDVTVFLNGDPIFAGRSGYQRRDKSFVGAIGYFDTVYLPCRKGLNELCLLVTDSFGGWGFQCKTDRELAEPIRNHARLRKLWETPAQFKIPESVLYDRQRDILYVSSFSRLGAANANTGFISKLTLDGRIEDLKWITGLDGPCWMGVHDDTLYVAECSGNLVAIDIPSGTITNRYPMPGFSFLNDLSVAPDGTVYITNSSRQRGDIDIYAFKDGVSSVWSGGDEHQRTNGIFINDDRLLVGNTSGGLLKSVALDDQATRTVACLGAGVVDGIRADNHGNYIVSHWEGQVYLISPAGEITEILDTTARMSECGPPT